GAALFQLKARLKHGSWGAWLAKNFKGSPESARLYMRIAKHWRLIEEHGLDRDGVTLEDLQWVLSESPGERPGAKKKEAKKGQKADQGLKLDAEGAGQEGGAPESNTRQVPLILSEDDKEEFEEQVRRLGVAYQTDNTTDTV